MKEEIIIVSDNHGQNDFFEILEKRHPNKKILHLGDIEIKKELIKDKNIIVVRGNSILDTKYDNDNFLTINGLNIYMNHGHNFLVKASRLSLAEYAKELKADILLYGHTHIPKYEIIDGVVCFCPGSTSRAYETEDTYGMIEITSKNDYKITLLNFKTGEVIWEK